MNDFTHLAGRPPRLAHPSVLTSHVSFHAEPECNISVEAEELRDRVKAADPFSGVFKTHTATVALHLSVPEQAMSQVSARQPRLRGRRWGRGGAFRGCRKSDSNLCSEIKVTLILLRSF